MDLYKILETLDIAYKEIEHAPIYTIAEAQNIKNKIEGVGCKNLLLTNKKNYFLVILEDSKRANIKAIEKVVCSTHMSFANDDELKRILNLKRGSVSPFGILNDKENKVILLIDEDLQEKVLLFHPNINTKTLAIQYHDLLKFIIFEKHGYRVFSNS